MPIWLRNFTYNEIVKYRKEEKKAAEKANKGQNSTSANIGDAVTEHMKKIFQEQKSNSSYRPQKSKK